MSKRGIFSVVPVATKAVGIVATKPKVVNSSAAMREYVRVGSQPSAAKSSSKPNS